MDGFEFIRQLREIQPSHEIIIIAVSASAFDDIRLRSLDAGCHDFLTKPFMMADLLKILKKWSLHLNQPGPDSTDIAGNTTI